MFHIVAASSFFHSINTLNRSEKMQYESLVLAFPGLSFNINSLNQIKNFIWLLEERKLMVWHDMVNKTINSHRKKKLSPSMCWGGDNLFEVREEADTGNYPLQTRRRARTV